MSKTIVIDDFMTSAPQSISSAQTITAALKTMKKLNVRHLPVLEAGKLWGIVSERELEFVSALDAIDADRASLEQAMIPEPFAVAPGTPLAKVVREMAHRKVGSALVAKDDVVVGIFTTIDALRALGILLEA